MMTLLLMNPPPGRRAAFRKFLAMAAVQEAERREAKALAEAETAFKAGRGEDGRAALAEADLYRGAAAGYRAFV